MESSLLNLEVKGLRVVFLLLKQFLSSAYNITGDLKNIILVCVGWVAGEMAQWLKALSALPEDIGPIPRLHIWWLTTTCNSSSRCSGAILKCLWVQMYMQVKHKHINKTEKYFKKERYKDIAQTTTPYDNCTKLKLPVNILIRK